MDRLRVAIADDDEDMQTFYRAVLSALNHEIVAQARSGRELVESVLAHHPNLIITDIKMPDMDGIEAIERLFAHDLVIPVILVSAFHDDDLMARARFEHILAYLVKPLKPEDIKAAIGIVFQRFEQFQELHREADSLKQALEDRKKIERAKGVIMRRSGLDENEAHRRLQLFARQRNKRLVEVADMILFAEVACEPPAPHTS